MTAADTFRRRGRSAAAVAAGFFTTALLSLGTDAVMHAAGVFPPLGEAMRDALFVWATAYRVVFTVLGGYVTAALAPRRPMLHVVILGTLGTLAATVGAVANLGCQGSTLVPALAGRHRTPLRMAGRHVAPAIRGRANMIAEPGFVRRAKLSSRWLGGRQVHLRPLQRR